MEFNEKETRFFNNPKLMQRFGMYAKYVPRVYARVVAVAPEMAEGVLERLADITVRTKPKLDERAEDGESHGNTSRALNNNRLQKGVRLLIKRPNEIRGALRPLLDEGFFNRGEISNQTLMRVDMEEYYRRNAFYHEMLHALAAENPQDGNTASDSTGPSGSKDKSKGVSKSDNIAKSKDTNASEEKIASEDTSNSENESEGSERYYYVVTGNITFARYDLNKVGCNRQNDKYSSMIEEGVVEDWANDITLEDIDNRYTRTTERLSIVAYRFFVSLVTCWNLCSNYQLRREFITGMCEDTVDSQQTEVFKSKMFDLCYYMLPAFRGDSVYDVDKIVDKYLDIIKYCDSNFVRKAHTRAECEKYDMAMAYLKTPRALPREIKIYANKEKTPDIDKVTREIETMLKEKIPYHERKEYDTIWYLKQMAREGRGVIKGDIEARQFVRWYAGDVSKFVSRLKGSAKSPTEREQNR